MVTENNTTNEREKTLVTTCEPKFVLGKSLVASGHEETLARMVITLVDISQRKNAEETLRETER